MRTGGAGRGDGAVDLAQQSVQLARPVGLALDLGGADQLPAQMGAAEVEGQADWAGSWTDC